jgi:metal-responsive CopG/Arc/MetJ family transcriptional regulator
MPVISFLVPEGIRNFVQKIVGSDRFKSQSVLFRAALSSYLNARECNDVDAEDYKITGTIMFTVPIDANAGEMAREICKKEEPYLDGIMVSSMINCSSCHVFSMSYEGSVFSFRELVSDMESIRGVGQVRYIMS